MTIYGDYIKKPLKDMTLEELNEEHNYQSCRERIAIARGADPSLVYCDQLGSIRKECLVWIDRKQFDESLFKTDNAK